MSNSVYGISLSGLNAARAGLSTTSNNIANSNTVGYTRQIAVQESRPANTADGVYMGQGVDIDRVQRMYSEFINSQVQKATSDASFFNAKSEQIARVDGIIADETSGIASALSDFFAAAQKLTTNPADLSARQSYLSSSETLASRFNAIDGVMDELRLATNLKVMDTVQQMNDASQAIATINKQIVTATNQTFVNGLPNELLDKRDQLILDLSKQVQLTRVNLDDGSVNLFLANGQALVVNDEAFQVRTEVDPNDPKNLVVGTKAVVNGQEKLIGFESSSLGTGALAGFLSFREGELTQYQNTIGLIAARIGEAVNNIHTAGVDLDGNAGQKLFSFGSSGNFIDDISNVVPSPFNSTTNTTNLTVRDIDLSKIKPVDYEILMVGGAPQYRQLGSDAAFSAATFVADPAGDYFDIRDTTGASLLSFQIDNTNPSDGDRFVLNPVSEAAPNMRVSLKNPVLVAASSNTNPSVGNNENMRAIVALQTSRTLNQSNGSAGVSISDTFNQLVSQVGNKTRELSNSADAREAVLNQVAEARDGLSGVNMDEEAANLLRYQQAYQASGRVMSMAKELFDQVLNLL